MDQQFIPTRHRFGESDACLDLDPLGDHAYTLTTLEHEIGIEVTQRRALAATLIGLGRKQTPHLAEHLAWLLERETDVLTAYSLYAAIRVTHPERWKLKDWMCMVIQTTPLPMLRTAMLQTLFDECLLDFNRKEDSDLLDTSDPEHRAILIQQRWLVDRPDKGGIDEVVSMLQPQASMPEKVAALQIVQFSNDPQIETHACPALKALFRVEHHLGLSLKIEHTLVKKCSSISASDLDMIAYLIRAKHHDGVVAAEVAMKRQFYPTEGYLLECFEPIEQRPSNLTTALLNAFSSERLPRDGEDVFRALEALCIDPAQPLAAFAATSKLQALRRPNAAGEQMVFSAAQNGKDPVAQALAIRVLGGKHKALLPLLDMLKALAVAPSTEPRVRRSAFHALVNTRDSGLPMRIKDIIDLYFSYLRQAPYSHFADAVQGSDVAQAPEYFLLRLEESFDAIESAAARQAAIKLVQKPFDFGIREEFAPYWLKVVGLMLRTLDEPKHDELHYMIFWNMLHEVAIPEPAVSVFAAGLKDRVKRVSYAQRIRVMIDEWLQANMRG